MKGEFGMRLAQWRAAAAVLAGLLLVPAMVCAQAAPHLLGTVTAISGSTITVKTAQGEEKVDVPSSAQLKRVEPGQTNLNAAVAMQFSELAVGDRVLVNLDPNASSPQALRVVAIKQSDVEKQRAQEQQEWAQGVGGLVKSVAGKAPRGADLLSVDRESSRLLLSCPSPAPPRLGEDASCATTAIRGSGGAAANGGGEESNEAAAAVTQSAQLAPAPKPPRELRIPPLALASFPNLEIRSDLIDVGCYVFDTETVAAALERGRGGESGRGESAASPSSSPSPSGFFAGLSLREDVVPYLVRKQFSCSASSSSSSSSHSAADDLLAYPVEATARNRGSGSGDGGGLDRADSATPPPPTPTTTAAPASAAAAAKRGSGGAAAASGSKHGSAASPPSPSASPPPPAVAAAAARRSAAAARRRALSRPARAFVLPRGALCLRAARGGALSFLDAAREVAAAAGNAEAAVAGGAGATGAQDEGTHGGNDETLSPPPPPPSLSPPSSSLLPLEAFPTVHPTATVAPKAAVAAGCLLGAGTTVGDRASVKRSALGSRCRVARSAKIVGCVLGDGVTVGEGAVLQNCAVGSGANVGARASLKECFVGPEVKVAEEFAAKEEVIVSASGAAAAAARARGGGGGGGMGAASGGGSHASDQFGFGSL